MPFITNGRPEQIELKNSLKDRKTGLSNIKRILRHNSQNASLEVLDVSFHRVFEKLFELALSEQSIWLNAKTSTTRSAADTRLSEVSSTLRLVIEVSNPHLKQKTLRALLDHLTQTLPLANGGLCTPLALDYAKCLHTALGFQPHVEHLAKDDWEQNALFCVDTIKGAVADLADDDADAGAERMSTAGTMSYRSSRSQHRESAGSQGVRSLLKQVNDELVSALSCLTAAPNAPLGAKASTLLWALVGFLKANTLARGSHQEAFAAINHILACTSTENIDLTQKVTSHVVRLIRHFWPQKMSLLREEMLKTLLHLRPYLAHLMRHEGALTLRSELSGLLDVLRSEYGRRLEREQLHLDDLRLAVFPTGKDKDGSIHTTVFELRCVGAQTDRAAREKRAQVESNWAVVCTIASLSNLLGSGAQAHASSDEDDDDDDINSRPRKRQRTSDEYEDTLSATSKGSASSRACALQTVAFLAQQKVLPAKQMSRTIDKLSSSCSEDNSAIASWSFLALASCASQQSSAALALSGRWNAVWQLASRTMSNASICRATCHLVSILLRLQLISQANVLELLQTITASMDLHGPTMLADSVLAFLVTALQKARQLSPGTVNALAEGALGWLFRMFSPSKWEDKAYAANHHLCETPDILRLISACVNYADHTDLTSSLPVWESVAQTWLACEQQQELIAYLLLLPESECPITPGLASDDQAAVTKNASAPMVRPSCEALTLNHVLTELQKTQDTWSQWRRERPLSISVDMFRSLCNACCVISCILKCHAFRDARRQTHAQKQLDELLDSIATFLASSSCDQNKVDAMLSASAGLFTGMTQKPEHRGAVACETFLCRHITQALAARRQIKDSNGDYGNDDQMDIDDQFDSQDSRRGRPAEDSHEARNEQAAAHSASAFRCNISLYAAVTTALENAQTDLGSQEPTASKCVINYVLSLPEADLFSSRTVLSLMPQLGLLLHPEDSERLLEYCTERFLSSYLFQRSEVAQIAILDIMLSLLPMWTDAENRSLHGLGADTYDWYIEMLSGKAMSVNVQIRLGTLLLQLCQVDTDYPREGDSQSARTSLFQLVKDGSIQTQHHLAGRVSTMFKLFVLSRHEDVFNDLQTSLSAETDWTEGMAIRLLFFSKLASAWHSLLRQCVYYIFETAGQVKAAAQYAAHCVKSLTESLRFGSAQKLFRLFAPQLLHTWLEQNTLNNLPYSVFQYASLDELLERNQVEVTAQVLMRGKDDSMLLLTEKLKITSKDLAKRAFAKASAYTISWDIAQKLSNTPDSSEARLRNTVGGKGELNKLNQSHFPTIIAQFYLSAQQEDAQDQWLDKKEAYAAAATALSEAKGHSQSTRTLPASQQPSFKLKHLIDQVERLCRRTGTDPVKPWEPSTFTLAVRMHMDAIDNALGPLHKCLILRKLRTLICMAGDVALSGYTLEMLLHSMMPFLSDSECADDALGVLRYLLQHGTPYVKRESPAFAHGVILSMILRMQEHTTAQPESTTQESQRRLTTQKMEGFRAWLVKYLQQCQHPSSTEHAKPHDAMIKALSTVRLPGNACKESSESSLLLLLLEQQLTHEPMLPRTHCIDALRLLTKGFEGPPSLAEDCLGSNDASVAYSESLWYLLSGPASTVDKGFLLWASVVLGRAYASTGKRPPPARRTAFHTVGKHKDGVPRSQYNIAECLADMMQSQDRTKAGLADWTLRNALVTFKEPNEALAFEQMLPSNLVPAVAGGTFGYQPPLAAEITYDPIHRQQLRQVLEVSPAVTDIEWSKRLAVTLCRWASNIPILPALPALLSNVPELAIKLLPSIAHVILVHETNGEAAVRDELSNSLAIHLAENDPLLCSRQRLLLEILLYLRSQPLPGEATQADRVRWLEIDLLLAADAAARCEMPTFALQLAESAAPAAKPNRRASSRVSMSQLTPVQVPDDLLISVFKQIEEPDSFYGVQQSASLESVLERFDYEGNGFRSLMFRSAQMDSGMRLAHQNPTLDSAGLMRSLSALNLHSLEYILMSTSAANASNNTSEMLDTARKLQQWDVPTPEDGAGEHAVSFAAFQELSRSGDRLAVINRVQCLLSTHAKTWQKEGKSGSPSVSWCNVLAVLTEVRDVLDCAGDDSVQSCWQNILSRDDWLRMTRYEDCSTVISCRATLFSVLAHNSDMLKAMRFGGKASKSLEVESLLRMAQFAREHGVLQEALSAATQVGHLAARHKDSGLNVTAAAKKETALTLWEAGEALTSVKMLREVLNSGDCESEHVPVGRSGLLAQLAHQLAEARMEKPDEILESCLKPAIKHLRGRNDGHEAGKVFYEFAVFCDQQLQNPGNLEDFNRIVKLRQKKEDEVRELQTIVRNQKKPRHEIHAAQKMLDSTRIWLQLDDDEYQRLKQSRDTFMHESLKNYLLALHASDEHDISILRFFAMWLENAESQPANTIVGKHLSGVPSWKFAVLNNQLMSRLEDEQSLFQNSLKALMQRICADHPHHSLHHLFAASRRPANRDDVAANSRANAAQGIRRTLQTSKNTGDFVKRTFEVDNIYNEFSQSDSGGELKLGKTAVNVFSPAVRMTNRITAYRVPPATISLPLRADTKYSDVPTIVSWDGEMLVMNGLSRPKALKARASNGLVYRQLFKSNDDLRQDAIMEQVFEEVSKMLRSHKLARQRNLHIRTYKVIPLGPKTGILEWVPNSVPIGDWLKPAHSRYYPGGLKADKAFAAIRGADKGSNDARIKEFRKVCEQMPPVLRHFHFERFTDPDEWFEKRTAYTRTTATVSILGYVLGLGDRHCQNILLDENSGEAVHIDLGVAFEAGRVLPIPETVPFRLSRDIVDAMGVTKTEGVFRRCCEFTMDALREDKDSIMTLLNVLRYDPLYNWSVSPLRAKRMQDAQETGRNAGAGGEEPSSKRKEQEAGEADRALSIVEKKLSKTLSTAATVNELIQQATDDRNLALLFAGWSAYF